MAVIDSSLEFAGPLTKVKVFGNVIQNFCLYLASGENLVVFMISSSAPLHCQKQTMQVY
jgi:hypothetical protein